MNYDKLLWNILKEHIGHNVSIVFYGDPENPADICLEDEDTNEVILDAEIYTICAREDGQCEIELSDIYTTSMDIGAYFKDHYFDDYSTEEWTCSGECAVYAERVYNMAKDVGIKEASKSVYKDVRDNGFAKIVDHGWDDFVRGFLAGEILGRPTPTNIEKAKEAERLWRDDDGEYGYYHEVLEEVE